MLWFFGFKAYRNLAPRLGIELALPELEGKVLTTGLPGKSHPKPFSKPIFITLWVDFGNPLTLTFLWWFIFNMIHFLVAWSFSVTQSISVTYVCVRVLGHVQLFMTPMDHSPPGSSVHGIFQARILGLHFLLQGIFPTQEPNLRLLHLLHQQAGSLQAEPPGKP